MFIDSEGNILFQFSKEICVDLAVYVVAGSLGRDFDGAYMVMDLISLFLV